jgi:very-short-patch-repair endonuclease
VSKDEPATQPPRVRALMESGRLIAPFEDAVTEGERKLWVLLRRKRLAGFRFRL